MKEATVLSRAALTPGRLYSLLSGEFKERRSTQCFSCRMPLPFVVERPGDGSANWRIGAPASCSHGCDALIGEIVARASALHDLLDPVTRPLPLETRG